MAQAQASLNLDFYLSLDVRYSPMLRIQKKFCVCEEMPWKILKADLIWKL